jgi:hypothetical protein
MLYKGEAKHNLAHGRSNSLESERFAAEDLKQDIRVREYLVARARMMMNSSTDDHHRSAWVVELDSCLADLKTLRERLRRIEEQAGG